MSSHIEGFSILTMTFLFNAYMTILKKLIPKFPAIYYNRINKHVGYRSEGFNEKNLLFVFSDIVRLCLL